MKKLIVIILILVTSCTTTKIVEVPIETIRTEYKDKIIKDVVYIKDSSNVNIRGDTVYSTKFIYKYVYKTDTIKIYKTDTIPKVTKIETIKEVNRLKNWQVILMVLGGGAIIIVINKLKRFIWK